MRPSQFNTSRSKPKRRWCQFSLRAMLLMVLLCGWALGWFGGKFRSKLAEPEAVLQIQRLGGVGWYNNGFPFRKGRRRYLPGPPWLRKLLGDDFFIHIEGVALEDGVVVEDISVTDENLVHLRALADLRILWLSATEISDDGLAHLKGLTRLEHLYIGDTRITDRGLQHLQSLPNLRQVRLGGTQVTDAGAEKLQHALPDCWIVR